MLTSAGLQDFLLLILKRFRWRHVSFVLDSSSDPWFKGARVSLIAATTARRVQAYEMNFQSFDGTTVPVSPLELEGRLAPVLQQVQSSSRGTIRDFAEALNGVFVLIRSPLLVVVVYTGGTRELRIMLVKPFLDNQRELF